MSCLPQGSDHDLHLTRSSSKGSRRWPKFKQVQELFVLLSPLSLSTLPVASLTVVDLVEEESWEASSDRGLTLWGGHGAISEVWGPGRNGESGSWNT